MADYSPGSLHARQLFGRPNLKLANKKTVREYLLIHWGFIGEQLATSASAPAAEYSRIAVATFAICRLHAVSLSPIDRHARQ